MYVEVLLGGTKVGIPYPLDRNSTGCRKLLWKLVFAVFLCRRKYKLLANQFKTSRTWGDVALEGWGDVALEGWGDVALEGWGDVALEGWGDSGLADNGTISETASHVRGLVHNEKSRWAVRTNNCVRSLVHNEKSRWAVRT